MTISFNTLTPTIKLDVQRYTNFYEIIRALNHEELHYIIAELTDINTCAYFDNLIHNFLDGTNSKFREELYELFHKDTKAISKEELINPKRVF